METQKFPNNQKKKKKKKLDKEKKKKKQAIGIIFLISNSITKLQ